MPEQWIDISYLIAAVLFIYALKMMSSPKTARKGNLLGATGMLIAIVFTVTKGEIVSWPWIITGLVIGSAIGAFLALRVQMTAMPQMVAMFNGFGGLASALVVLGGIYMKSPSDAGYTQQFVAMTGVSSLIGWVTFTGSLVAFAKLQELFVSGRPVVFPLQKVLNFALLAIVIALIVTLGYFPQQRWLIVPIVILASALGVLFVIPIGGADMPVVISLLNSYSGLAAAATGFVLGNTGLIVAGSVVGA